MQAYTSLATHNQSNIDGRKHKTEIRRNMYFSFHFQTLFVNSSLLKSTLFIPSDASILSTTNWEKNKEKN